MNQADWKNILMKVIHQFIINGDALITDSLCDLTEEEVNEVIEAYKEYCDVGKKQATTSINGDQKRRVACG